MYSGPSRMPVSRMITARCLSVLRHDCAEPGSHSYFNQRLENAVDIHACTWSMYRIQHLNSPTYQRGHRYLTSPLRLTCELANVTRGSCTFLGAPGAGCPDTVIVDYEADSRLPTWELDTRSSPAWHTTYLSCPSVSTTWSSGLTLLLKCKSSALQL